MSCPSRSRVLRTGGPWRVFGSILMVKTWSRDFDPVRDEIRTRPVWVRIANLPVNFYHKTILMGIAGGLGKPIKVDLTSLRVERARFARVCGSGLKAAIKRAANGEWGESQEMASSSSSRRLIDGGTRNWADLPAELTCSILLRIGTIQILRNVQRVCRSWRLVCKDPSMWREIDMRNHGISDGIIHSECDRMCRHAVDLSQGRLDQFNLGDFGTDSLLSYVAERSSYLRCLRLTMRSPITGKGLVNAVMKLPFLEDLQISDCYPRLDLRAIGHSCPLLKTLKLSRPYFFLGLECDDDALAIAETMPELRRLELVRNRLRNSGLNAILDSCLYLDHLHLCECFFITLAGDLEKRCSERIKDLRLHSISR